MEVTWITFRDMGAAFGVALLGIYILVVAQFGSFRLPLVFALACIPLYVVMIEGWAMLWTTTCIAFFAAGYIAAWPIRCAR